MIIYSSDVGGFKKDIFEGRLIDTLDRQIARSYKASSYMNDCHGRTRFTS